MKATARNHSQYFIYMEILLSMGDPLCFPFLFFLQDNDVSQYLSCTIFCLINKWVLTVISGFFVWVFCVYYETLLAV